MDEFGGCKIKQLSQAAQGQGSAGGGVVAACQAELSPSHPLALLLMLSQHPAVPQMKESRQMHTNTVWFKE